MSGLCIADSLIFQSEHKKMIKEIRLKNWKSFKDATLYIDPLTMIIGANAGGKSNALDALLLLNRICSGIGIFQAINGDVNIPALRGGIEWVCLKPENHFTFEVVVDGIKEKQDYLYKLTVQANGTKAEVFQEELTLLINNTKERVLYTTKREESNSPALPTYFWTGAQGRGKRIDLNRSCVILSQTDTINLRKEVQDGAKQVVSQMKSIFVFDPIPSHMRGYSALSEKVQSDGSNVAGVLAALEDSQKREIEDTITNYLKELPERDIKRVWAESVGKFKTDAMLYCEEGWEGAASHEIDARGMSDGTLRYLAIVAALLTRKKGSLLVIEEVDNGLHPSRAKVLINMLRELGKKRRIDIIVTTHNPAMLDAAGVQMVPFITVAHRDNKTGVSLLTLLEDIEQLPKLMASGSLGDIASEGIIESAVKAEN
jgi:predicted ATPase